MRVNHKQKTILKAIVRNMRPSEGDMSEITLDELVAEVQQHLDPEYRQVYFRSGVNQAVRSLVPKLLEHGITLKVSNHVGRGNKACYQVSEGIRGLVAQMNKG